MSSIMSGAPGCIRAIRRRIEESLVTSISKQRFLPRDKLYEIFTLPTIKGAVQELNCGAEYRIKLVDTINNDCKILFAILIYNRLEDYITEFRRHGFLDSQLPLTKERAEEIMGSEFGPRLALDFQWMFLPYVFRKSMLECSHQIGERYILPFITAEQIGTGAFGDVDKVGVLPSQHEFPVQGTTELHVVRKRLRFKGRMQEFNREDKCLRLLNRLKHQNIIPLLGSYTYGEEHSFLFPYFSMNLDEFLRAKERPGDFRWNFTFCSALAGLASALSKMHRLHLNEEEHDVDFEAVGYHHDLRPPNVLVSEDTFILADFGLGSLKDRAALSHTPYKIVGGDYIAPECTDMDENPQTVNRSIDVWAFGCLILEIITYIVKGPDGIQEFRKKRLTKGRLQQFKDAGFYKPDGELKQEVLDWTEELRSLNSHKDLVDRLLPLSLDCLQTAPQDRPNMDEVSQRLSALSVQEHFDSVQHMFLKVLDAADQSPLPQHHIECLQLAQRRLQKWAEVFSVTKKGMSNVQHESLGRSSTIMRSLFHILRKDQDQRAFGDISALRPSQHQIDRCMKQLLESLPDGLGEAIESQYTEAKAAGSGILEEMSSLPDNVNADVPHASLVTHADGLLSEFERFIESFKDSLPDTVSLDEIIQVSSIEEVYDITDKLQTDQELRNLSKIGPYLQRLRSYSELVEGVIGGSHGVLAFLWGPFTLLLLWSSKDDKAYRCIIDAIAEIGKALPDFQERGTELGLNAEGKEILVLFFRDILNFYLVTLKPFSHPGWMCIFDRSWPKYSALISEVASHIGRLTRLMRTEICLEHIQQEHEFRKNALEAFEKQARESRKQEFFRIKTSLNLWNHDETLYRLRGVTGPETGSWLFSNEAYTAWFNGSRRHYRTLWLVGIPGAGKTILSCAVVNRLRKLQPNSTGFAFLTYENERITAISVIHSLIFQLADRDDDLVGVVCESAAEDLKTDLAVARNLLASIVQNFGSAYLVIDGIDEISIEERGRLVIELLKLGDVCERLRIILSSRAEADLMHKLENTAVPIRVQDHNEESISAYISHRIQEMFSNREVSFPERAQFPIPEREQAEIKKLLVPLASRAEGMFLYVRLIMGRIEDMNDFSEIQKELVDLPEGLDAAYDRILTRLRDEKNKRKAEKAQRLLGFVACTPTPLTVEEASQALVFDPCQRDQVYNMIHNLDPVKTLGPIVEVVDGYIRFVHFTAKEYISSTPLGAQLVDKNQATLDLAVRCLGYLSQDHHDLDLPSQKVSRNVLTGQYSFHGFAAKMWFELSRQHLRSATVVGPSTKFVESLQMLWETRKSQSFQMVTEVVDSGEKEVGSKEDSKDEVDFQPLKERQPILHQFLCNVSRFRRSSFVSTANSVRDTYKNEGDPLSISEVSHRIRGVLEDSLCTAPHGVRSPTETKCHGACVNIMNYYGARPFKCNFMQCEFWMHGFGERSSRNKHERTHDLPLTCHVSGCKYRMVGFLSETMRQKHLQQAHRNGQLDPVFDTQKITKDAVKALLFDLVRENQVGTVRQVLSTLSDTTMQDLRNSLRLVAASSASGAMLEILEETDFGSSSTRELASINHAKPMSSEQHDCIKKSIQAQNRGAFEFLVERCIPFEAGSQAPRWHTSILCQLLSIDWTEGTELWCRWLRLHQQDNHVGIFIMQAYAEALLLSKDPIKAAAIHSAGEKQLLYVWRQFEFFHQFEDTHVLADGMLKLVSEFSCSITLAEYLLQKGARINSRRGRGARTALHCAAGRDSAEGAEMMKYLLIQGADPEADMDAQTRGRPVKRIRDERGPRGIHTWLGISWDKPVEETRQIRETREIGRVNLG